MKIGILGHSQVKYLDFDDENIQRFFRYGATLSNISTSKCYYELIDFNPDLVIVFLGSTDIVEYGYNQTKEIVKKLFELKFKILKEIKPVHGVKFLEIEPRKSYLDVNRRDYTSVRNGVANKLKTINHSDFISLSSHGLDETCIGPDGIHLNYSGSQIIVKTILDFIKNVL